MSLSEKIMCLACLAICVGAHAQQNGRYEARIIAFYNLENLFDTENDSLTFDDDRTPGGKDRWTRRRYTQKIDRLGNAISGIGKEITGSPPDLVGICEVENLGVLTDLINHPLLVDSNYGVVHFDSPDERGIDVALLYKKHAFGPVAIKSHRLLLYNLDGKRNYTRDPLVVSGTLDGEMIHLIVNHWPSRSGGQIRSAPYRNEAARLNLSIMDSLIKASGSQKIILMGDFNDNPTDDSLRKILNAKGDTSEVMEGLLYNPMEKLFKRGAGSLAYRNSWHLFDQILLNHDLVKVTEGNYRFWKAGIYNPARLVSRKGRFRGYPARTYSGGRHTNGYSDHFPVYVCLIREVP